MRFGKIDYLNLLPFHVFMKRYLRSSRAQMALRYGRNVPSRINRAFETRRIDAAFISSIKARHHRHAPLGIIAKGPVQSVLLIPGEAEKNDTASATSNILARVLGLQGEVLIGDRALRAFLAGVEAVDLAQAWRQRYGLPFVFALLAYHGRGEEVGRLGRAFARDARRIPQYLLKEAAQRSGIPPEAIRAYLENIDYLLDHRSRRGVEKFWRLAAQLPRPPKQHRSAEGG